VISVLNDAGEIETEIIVNECPELTGLYFSGFQEEILYATESSTNSLLKIQINASQ
jgi:hypothetical protein